MLLALTLDITVSGLSIGLRFAARAKQGMLLITIALTLLTSLMGCSTTRVTVDRDSSIRFETVTVGDIRIEPRLVKLEQEKLVVAGYVIPLTNTLGSQVGHLHVASSDNQGKIHSATCGVATPAQAPSDSWGCRERKSQLCLSRRRKGCRKK